MQNRPLPRPWVAKRRWRCSALAKSARPPSPTASSKALMRCIWTWSRALTGPSWSMPVCSLRSTKDAWWCSTKSTVPRACSPELRGLIDQGRRRGNRTGLFLILGSASMDLLKQSGETLAGRIEYVPLGPFDVLDVPPAAASTTKLWVRGGLSGQPFGGERRRQPSFPAQPDPHLPGPGRFRVHRPAHFSGNAGTALDHACAQPRRLAQRLKAGRQPISKRPYGGRIHRLADRPAVGAPPAPLLRQCAQTLGEVPQDLRSGQRPCSRTARHRRLQRPLPATRSPAPAGRASSSKTCWLRRRPERPPASTERAAAPRSICCLNFRAAGEFGPLKSSWGLRPNSAAGSTTPARTLGRGGLSSSTPGMNAIRCQRTRLQSGCEAWWKCLRRASAAGPHCPVNLAATGAPGIAGRTAGPRRW